MARAMGFQMVTMMNDLPWEMGEMMMVLFECSDPNGILAILPKWTIWKNVEKA